MLTKELLKKDPTLATLPDAQLDAIALLSKNDEDAVIGRRIADVYTGIDNDIKSVTGEDKPGGVKTFDHLKNVLTSWKTKAAKNPDVKKLNDQIAALTTEKKDLEKKIADGTGDQVLRDQVTSLNQKLKDANDELGTVRTTFATAKETYEKQIADQATASINLEVAGSISSHIVAKKLVFNDAIPKTVLDDMLKRRENDMLSELNPDKIDDGKGGKTMVFRNEAGEIMRNPENGLRPFTAGELFQSRITDLIKPGKEQRGGGTDPNKGGGGNPPSTQIDMTNVRTRIQGDEMISKHVISVEGIAKTNPNYGTRVAELRAEHKVMDLPMKEQAAE
jgi:hypothetical protein